MAVRQCTNGMTVKVDAEVLLRIAKHSKQLAPNPAFGCLLGLTDTRTQSLRVSSCFAEKSKKDALLEGPFPWVKEDNNEDLSEFQEDNISTLREVRVDANAVGWYASADHGNSLMEGLVDFHYSYYQKENPSGIVIIYDASQQKIGKCGFKAYRLSDAAMKKKKDAEENGDEDPFSDFHSDELFEEVPVSAHCSPLVETLLLQEANKNNSVSLDSLDMDSMTPTFERNVQLLLETLDDFSMQQREMQLYERQTRRQKESIPKNQKVPKSVDTLNLSKQIQLHCKTIDDYATDSFGRLYVVSQKPEIREVLKSLNV